MPRPKMDDPSANGAATAVHPALAMARQATSRIQSSKAKGKPVPQAPLPAFAADKAEKKKIGTPVPRPEKEPAGPKKPAPKPPAKSKRTPTPSELNDAIEALRAFKAAGERVSPVLKRMLVETWPIVDQDREGEHYFDQAMNLTDTNFEVASSSVIDMSIDAALEDVDALLADMAPGPGQGAWARDVLAAATPAGKQPSRRAPRPKVEEPEPEEVAPEVAPEVAAEVISSLDEDLDGDEEDDTEIGDEDELDDDDFEDDEDL